MALGDAGNKVGAGGAFGGKLRGGFKKGKSGERERQDGKGQRLCGGSGGGGLGGAARAWGRGCAGAWRWGRAGVKPREGEKFLRETRKFP